MMVHSRFGNAKLVGNFLQGIAPAHEHFENAQPAFVCQCFIQSYKTHRWDIAIFRYILIRYRITENRYILVLAKLIPGPHDITWNKQHPAMTWLRHVLKAIRSGFNQSLQ